MSYHVISYPKFSSTDFEWMQEYRRVNDRQYSFIEPHFTLAGSEMPRADFLREAGARSEGAKPINVVLSVATVNIDPKGTPYHTFLLPEIGYAALVKFYDQLHSGAFGLTRNLATPFIPHVNIGNSEDPQVCKRRVDKLNADGVSIKAVVDTLDFIEYKDGAVTTLQQISLR